MRFHSLYLAVALMAAAPAFADDVLQQADTLIRQQQAAQAYELLAPLEDERAGDPQYDYLLGVSLLETGDPSRAIFAFERCLAVEPKNGPCRVQMARTHLAIGETPDARAELQTIKEYNPPADVQALVSQYLGVIDKVEKQQKRHITAYAQAGVGYDSNINSAPSDANKAAAIFPTVFGIAPTNPTSEEAGYASVLAGAGLQYKITPSLIGLADINLQNRSFNNHNESNYQTADVSAGAAYQHSRSQIIGKLQYQNMWLDSQSYRNSFGVLGQYQYSVSDLAQLAAFTQLNQLRYDGALSNRDADRMTLGVAYSQAYDSKMSPVFYSSLYGGNENTKESAFDWLSQDFLGLRVGGSLQLSEKLKLNGAASLEKRDFQASFPFLLVPKKREDSQVDLSIGLAWKLSPKLSLQPNYAYTRTNSNIDTIDSTRHIVGVDLRFDL